MIPISDWYLLLGWRRQTQLGGRRMVISESSSVDVGVAEGRVVPNGVVVALVLHRRVWWQIEHRLQRFPIGAEAEGSQRTSSLGGEAGSEREGERAYWILSLACLLSAFLFHTERISSLKRTEQTTPHISSPTWNCSPTTASSCRIRVIRHQRLNKLDTPSYQWHSARGAR